MPAAGAMAEARLRTSPRVRRTLCQASWASVRHDPQEQAAYARIVEKNPKKKKIAVVAAMRRLAIRMWHRGLHALDCKTAIPLGLPSILRPFPQVEVGFSEASTGCPKGGKKRLGKTRAVSRG